MTAAGKQTFWIHRLPIPGPKTLKIAMIDALVAVGALMCASGTNQLNSQQYDRTWSKTRWQLQGPQYKTMSFEHRPWSSPQRQASLRQGLWIHNDSKAIPWPREHIAVTVAAKQ